MCGGFRMSAEMEADLAYIEPSEPCSMLQRSCNWDLDVVVTQDEFDLATAACIQVVAEFIVDLEVLADIDRFIGIGETYIGNIL